MIFKSGTKLYHNEVVRDAGEEAMYVNYIGYPSVPSLADSALVMSRTVDGLISTPKVSRMVFVQQRNYSYPFAQVNLLREIAQIYTYLIDQEKILSSTKLISCQACLPDNHNALRWLVLALLKQDPIGCYVEAKRILRESRINLPKLSPSCKSCGENFIKILEQIILMLKETTMIKTVEADLVAHRLGNRDLYRRFFRPDIIPNFTFTRLMASIPAGAELLDEYTLEKGFDKTTVSILKVPNVPKPIYHLTPPEFTLKDEFYELVDLARSVLIEHRPKAEEFVDPTRTREVFFNISRDLLRELAESRKVSVSYRQLNKLASILVRHTIGFGLVEVLLQDENLQDIVINAPIGQTPIFLRHGKWEECTTNILPSSEDADAWAARFRMLSGRPLDEANPVLDTDLSIGNVRARVSVIQRPLSPQGLSYAFRRHREMPWTLPLFIKNRMLTPLASGILGFLVDGGRTILVAGTRSSGKTSLLGSLMLEIMPRTRIIAVEDTLEMPLDSMRKLGYNVVSMKVRSALLKETTEMPADEGIRTSLRLGDSSLIVGEVRSVEAKALYEAMRIGALANVVAGTIHGGSPYAVFDRVVNDLGVPVTSFKATDMIIVANPIKTPDGLHSVRRVTQLTEVRKKWKEDPLLEKGFSDLMNYNVKKDMLEPTSDLINGESEVIKSIAGQVKGWAGNWDAIWDNILLRAKVKETLVRQALHLKKPGILEAPFMVQSNNAFHEIADKVTADVGIPIGKTVYHDWEKWLKKEIRNMK
ncbi:ATPase, T2SS/T4P/T4SS family [Nanoarchaeota archaeon]